MKKNLLQSSLLDAACGIVFQVFCRFVTFGINAFIVRNVGREVLGIMNVRLLLLESTLLFLSKEAIVRAALSATTQQRDKCSWPQLINQMWLSVVTCLVLCIPCLHVWINWLSPVNAEYVQQYEFGCYAVALSCIIELCAEPAIFLVQVFCFIKLKVVFQTLYILIRSLIFLWIVLRDKNMAINAFAIAQLSSAITIFCSHYIFFYFYMRRLNEFRLQTNNDDEDDDDDDEDDKYKKQKNYTKMNDFPLTTIVEFLPGQLKNDERFFNTELQVLTVSFVRQSILKQILTEGEKYVMSVSPVLSFSEQATYDVVNNLGSLAARFIFRPIEESSYFYFTQTLSRDIPLEKQPRQSVEEAGRVLSKVSLVVTSIALLVLTFGFNYAYTALYLYGGAEFVAGGLPETLLQCHCLAICFIAVNGITEGYMFATNTSADIDKYNYLMAIFSVSFLLLSYVLTSFMGPVGFILANCINMFCRICYSTTFIYKQFKPLNMNPLVDGLVPGKVFAGTLLMVGLLCYFSKWHSGSMWLHLGFGIVAGLLSLLAWGLEQRDLVKLGLNYVRRR